MLGIIYRGYEDSEVSKISSEIFILIKKLGQIQNSLVLMILILLIIIINHRNEIKG